MGSRQGTIAYLMNQYPKVSHSFIRREIKALELAGYSVARFAVRGWDGELVDRDDIADRDRTTYLLRFGAFGIGLGVLKIAFSRPIKFFFALGLALKLGWRADRPLFIHLVYLAEAAIFLEKLQQIDARHVHAHFGTNPAEVAMLTNALGGPPFSFTVHGPEEFDMPGPLKLREKSEAAAFVVAISSFGRSQLQRWLKPKDWHKIAVVHCGLDHEFYAIDALSESMAPRIACIGRLCEQKGQLVLVEACSILVREGVEIEIVFVGDGEMRGEIEAMIDRLGLARNIRILGWQDSDSVRRELLAARAMALPSFAEGLPVVIMEAMALGRPVISTYVAGIPELVRDRVDGYLVPASDAPALASALRSILALEAADLKTMGEQARSRALERHNVDVEAAKLAALIDAVGRHGAHH